MASYVDQYALKMQDMISAPLRRIEAQMDRVAGLMERMQGGSGAGGLTSRFGQLSTGVRLLGGAAGVAAAGLYGLYRVMEFGVTTAVRFGVAIGRAVLQAAQFRQQNIGAMDILLGKGMGEKTFSKALDIGGITPSDELHVVEQVRELAAAGFKGGGLSRANAALLDVEALMGRQNSDLLREYMGKFLGSSKVEADDLRRSAILSGFEGGEAGLKARLVKNATGKSLTGKALDDRFDRLKKSSKISGHQVIEALFQGINERLSEGKGLGSAARKMGEGTLSGLISNLEAAPQRFLAQMRLEDMPGIKALMDFIKRLLVFFDHSTEQGKMLKRVVEDVTNVLFGGLRNITSQDLAGFFRGAVRVANQLVEILRQAWGWVEQLLHGDSRGFIASMTGVLIESGKLIGIGLYEGVKLAMQGKAGQERARLEQAGVGGYAANVQMGYAMSSGVSGFEQQTQKVRESLSSQGVDLSRVAAEPMRLVGEDAVAGMEVGARAKAESHSPSMLMARVGEDLVDGLMLGIRRRAEQMAEGTGEAGELEDQLVHVLRRVAVRTGSPLTQGAV